jgi:hypothetical protein
MRLLEGTFAAKGIGNAAVNATKAAAHGDRRIISRWHTAFNVPAFHEPDRDCFVCQSHPPE